MAQRTWDTSRSLKLGWLTASQKMAGVPTTQSVRYSTMALRRSLTLKTGRMTLGTPRRAVTSSWLLQPVTWNSGTEMSMRTPSSAPWNDDRRQVSMFERKFSCVVIAPLG